MSGHVDRNTHWTIEAWHRVLKSGYQVEVRQFGDITRFLRATALFTAIAWRILFATTLLGREEADVSCEVLLQCVEWEALYCRIHRTDKSPAEPPKLGDAVLWIAQLGGYLNRKYDRSLGATVLWRGFHALREISGMYLIKMYREGLGTVPLKTLHQHPGIAILQPADHLA